MATNKAAVPKRIGGVRLPKPLRQSLKKLRGSKTGRARIAEALAAAGGALAAEPRAPAARRLPRPKSAAKVAAKPKAKATPKPGANSAAPASKAKRPPRPALPAAQATPPAPDVVAPPAGNGAGT
jgi:histone H1/5